MISSPSAQIVNAIAESTWVKGATGEPAPAYGPTMGVATAIIATGIIVTTAFGPEKRGRRFETAVLGAQDEITAKATALESGLEKPVDEKSVRSVEMKDASKGELEKEVKV